MIITLVEFRNIGVGLNSFGLEQPAPLLGKFESFLRPLATELGVSVVDLRLQRYFELAGFFLDGAFCLFSIW